MSAAPIDRSASEPQDARPRVQSAARAVAILLAVARSDAGLTPREISERVAISRQTAYHLLHTLTGCGVLARDDGNRYVLGLHVGTLAEGFRRQLAPTERLGALVRKVVIATGETAYAAGWWAGAPTTLHVAHGRSTVQAAAVPQGYGDDAHARASGKLLLAHADPALRAEYLQSHALRRLTPWTIVGPRQLDAELERIRAQGYAVDRQEFAEGLSCLAIPLDDGRLPFALGISAPTERFDRAWGDYLDSMRQVTAEALPQR
ncbi:IclR family transcriptional regulator [Conexibacter woesei]|uniref:Transcriptional regulator, IclR family n=1 Tax=Conexibacter woesei (strain DSM 14684 / CCUG 47730 / CIP 108061 / JCM 11494 / NBRC 100937 / ID131577) TaxID=469383 RepID=D3F397_CONWI|nr:IclR family transcriptional regulator [Conexibacter woesei]ADB50377.1 transcriptional regulator, IclR family [Conexibacter woesei DSM 14684]